MQNMLQKIIKSNTFDFFNVHYVALNYVADVTVFAELLSRFTQLLLLPSEVLLSSPNEPELLWSDR